MFKEKVAEKAAEQFVGRNFPDRLSSGLAIGHILPAHRYPDETECAKVCCQQT